MNATFPREHPPVRTRFRYLPFCSFPHYASIGMRVDSEAITSRQSFCWVFSFLCVALLLFCPHLNYLWPPFSILCGSVSPSPLPIVHPATPCSLFQSFISPYRSFPSATFQENPPSNRTTKHSSLQTLDFTRDTVSLSQNEHRSLSLWSTRSESTSLAH
jgi:hypothetical protein